MMYFESQSLTQFAQLEVSLTYMSCDLQSSVSMEANHNNCLGFWGGVGAAFDFSNRNFQMINGVHSFLINSQLILN